jgi:3-phosphoshikimate 1-carboxyvinyltransferase
MMDFTIGRTGPVNVRVTAPPSKSYTHRAIIIAGLADGTSVITGQLDADDTRITARIMAALGARIRWEDNRITVQGTGGNLISPSGPLDAGDSGTSMRLLTAVCLLADREVILTGSQRMQERPIGPLVQALNNAGATIRYLGNEGYPPLSIGGGLPGGNISIDGSVSSQFISSMLIVSPYAERDSIINLIPPWVSGPYISITTEMMGRFGITPNQTAPHSWTVPSHQSYRPCNYTVEGDYSSASYWFAIAAVTGGRVTVEGLNPASKQGDRRLLDILEEMGCSVTWEATTGDGTGSVTVSRTGSLKGVDVNMTDSPDVVQTLSVVAAVAETCTRIRGIHHLRAKESDRIEAIRKGLHTLGISVTEEKDGITINPGPVHGGIIHPERDHRTAMSFAVLGSVIGGVTILDAGCVSKSYPGFWEVFKEVWKTGGSC